MIWFLLFVCTHIQAIDIKPIYIITNPTPHYSLVNSADFHQNSRLFCVTYTHSNTIALYQLNTFNQPTLFQLLKNPKAQLQAPANAVFSPNGQYLIAINWTHNDFNIYKRQANHFFQARPIAAIFPPPELKDHKPHGMACSPCGHFLAVAYGATPHDKRAIALFQMDPSYHELTLKMILDGEAECLGIPKGITFSPDGSCLLTSFADTNRLAVFTINREQETLELSQIIQGPETLISRPEDIKITPDGKYCAISNSDQDNVAFYAFDSQTNRIIQSHPVYILRDICFPHGIAFSPHRNLLLVTEFGPVSTTTDGHISWDANTKPTQAKIHLYRFEQ